MRKSYYFMPEFKKPPLSIEQQIDLLKNRGLIINNPERTIHYLRFIGYYRLSGYARHFQIPNDPKHIFKQNTSFDDILKVYIFDRQLRLLVMDAIERIEVAFRTTISNIMSEKYGTHWYMNQTLFIDKFQYDKFIEKVEMESGYQNPKKQAEFCKHYFAKYTNPHLPPSWMVAEILPIGTWSNIFANLKNRDDQKQISAPYKLHYDVIRSWLHSFTYLRNLCAHHERLWNRKFAIKPKIADDFKKYLRNDDKFYTQAVIQNVFLSVIAKGSLWTSRLFTLLKENPHIPMREMGFFENWHTDPFWRIQQSLYTVQVP